MMITNLQKVVEAEIWMTIKVQEGQDLRMTTTMKFIHGQSPKLKVKRNIRVNYLQVITGLALLQTREALRNGPLIS